MMKKTPKTQNPIQLFELFKVFFVETSPKNTEISSCKRYVTEGFNSCWLQRKDPKDKDKTVLGLGSKGFFGCPRKQEMVVFRMSAIFKGSLALEGSYNLQWIPQLLLSLCPRCSWIDLLRFIMIIIIIVMIGVLC